MSSDELNINGRPGQVFSHKFIYQLYQSALQTFSKKKLFSESFQMMCDHRTTLTLPMYLTPKYENGF